MSQAAAWSDDRITALSSLWRDGLSASQIAAALGGVTRNAVIGKVHRLGLAGRAEPARPRGRKPSPATRPPVAPVRRSARSPRLAAPPQAEAEGPGLIADLAILAAHACKWPIGDPKAVEFSFCGRPANGPYCPNHAAIAFRPGAARALEKDRGIRRVLERRAA